MSRDSSNNKRPVKRARRPGDFASRIVRSLGLLKISAIALVVLTGLLGWFASTQFRLFLAERSLNQLYSRSRPFPYRWSNAPHGTRLTSDNGVRDTTSAT